MQKQLCLVLLKNKYDRLTKAERKLADYVLAASEEVLSLSAAELAKKSGTASSAVIRFCKTLGFSGYKEFKLSLAAELANQKTASFLPSHITREDDALSAFQKTFVSGIHALQNTYEMLDKVTVIKAVDMLYQAKQICFFGVGTSATIAIDAQYRIMQLGYPASCATDVLYMQVAAQNLVTGDVAIAISHSGQTDATTEALKTARKNGAFTIALTSFKDSTICRYADLVLNVYAEENSFDIEAVSARIAHITMLDAVMVALALKDYDKAAAHLEKRNIARQKIMRKELSE